MTPLRELYDLYCYPNPAKEERRRQLLTEIPTDARDEENYGRTSLHIAAEFADCEAIAALLDRGAEVNDRDTEGHTPLFRLASRRSRVAAQEEQIASAARRLLERGANLPRSARGTTALIEAVQNRHHAMAAVLIDSGQRLDSANSYGDNALHILCRRAADTAREIAGKERFIASFGERWVSEKQQREAREELEELRAEQMRCYATAALLLHSGQIDPDEKNTAGQRAFDLAAEGGAKWVGALLSGEDPFDELTMETGGMNLFQALRKRDRKALEALLQAAVDPDAECDDREMNDWTGKTPLVCALEWGETEIAAMLLRAGANPDRRTAKGMSPFAVWIDQGCRVSDGMERFAPLMELFEQGGWHPDAPQTGKDERALMLACQHDDYELATWTLRRLLKQKVEVNARDAMGRTALMHLLGPHSAGPYQSEMLERLLEAGADPCAADNVGRTVLHYAAEGYTHAAARQAADRVSSSALGSPQRRLSRMVPENSRFFCNTMPTASRRAAR